MTVLNLDTSNLRKVFLDPDGPVGIQRFDVLKYPIFDKLTKQQNSVFWLPDEVDCTKDPKDFRGLSAEEQHIFTSNISRQILLDSLQGRAPMQVLGPITCLPEVEMAIGAWTYFEQIHSRSYTHIIQSIYSDPTEILDGVLKNDHIRSLAKTVSEHYDELDRWNVLRHVRDNGSWFERFLTWASSGRYNEFTHKQAIWCCLHAINALEGIRFYVSFACSWAFAELKKMEGNAKIIKMIARDENIHLAITQNLIKILPKDDPDFDKISKDPAMQHEIIQIFKEVIEQEKEWARFLFKDGSMIGLNYDLLAAFIDEIAYKRLRNIGITLWFTASVNVLPWTRKWMQGNNVQVAPQETEISDYVQDIKSNVSDDFVSGLSL